MATAVQGATAQGSFQPDSDVHITFEDQQKINNFAKLNARLENCKDELKQKQKELTNLADACEEMELLDDDVGKIPFYMGEVFIDQDLEATKEMLEETKKEIESDIQALESKSAVIKEQMSDLKTQLYAKFGNHINLEADED